MERKVSPAGAGQAPIVSGFDAVRCLGGGAQGHVWLLAPRDGGPAVAAKILGPGAADGPGVDAEAVRQNEIEITQEWRILTQFSHEHLIAVQGVVHDSLGALVLLMDYAAGGSLGHIVRTKGSLTVGEAVTVLTPLGQVLSYLHGRGAVHGDVSAGNVLLSAAGKPFLGDFGLGRLLGQGAAALTGTPGFVCAHDVERNEAADVYGLAAVGWFALTGHTPPPTRDRLPLSTFVRDVPTELVAALEAGLHEDAKQRPTAAAFAQAVFRSARAEPVALANAVHPSVLPELLTRQATKAQRRQRGQGRKRRRVRQLFPRRPAAASGPAPRAWHQRGRSFFRRDQRLGRLWGGDGRSGGRHGGSGHGGGLGRSKGITSAAVVLAVLLVAAGGLLLGPAWFNALAGAQRGAQQSGPAGQAMATTKAPSMAWAAALPAQVQRGLAAQEPVEALTALAWTHSYALSTADAKLLAKINAPGSPALATDTAILADLAELGHSFTGLETRISAAVLTVPASAATGTPTPTTASQATVKATVTTSSFAERDAQGTVVHNHAHEQSQELSIVLTRMDSRWVIDRILPAGTKK
ncbi:serine/threonine protein kinase [Arthrobacter sp. TMN-49]